MLYTKFLTPDECAGKTAYERFKELREAKGSRWAKIFADYKKQGLPIWFESLDDAFDRWCCIITQLDKRLPIDSYNRPNGDYIAVDFNDILPHDGTIGYIRYQRTVYTEQGKQDNIYKARIGKIVREYLDYEIKNKPYAREGTPLTAKMIDYFADRTADTIRAFQAANAEQNPRFHLEVDEDFEFIYSSCNHFEHKSFGSCQTNRDLYPMLSNIEGAKAIKLMDNDGKMHARAIYYTEIHNVDSEEVLRGIERIYSADGDDGLKRTLLELAIRDGLVDCFKTINATAYDTQAWIRYNGDGTETPMHDCKLYVTLKRPFEDNDPVAWGDSFKYYVERSQIIYNYEPKSRKDNLILLNNTEMGFTFRSAKRIEGTSWYDEYEDCYRDRSVDGDPVYVFVGGCRYRTTEDIRDRDFEYVPSVQRYQSNEEVVFSDYYNCYVLLNEARYCEYIEDYIYECDAVEVYVDHDKNLFQYMPIGHSNIVECDAGYYIFEDDAIWIGDIAIDKNNATVEIDGKEYRLVEVEK